MFNFFNKTDSQIQKDVTTELLWDPRVKADHINVAAQNGIVTLSGSVPHYFEKSSAEEAAQRVGGVRAVADEIEVKLLGSFERTDQEIAEAALNALKWNYSTPEGVKVTVEKGWITLTGQADWEYERTAARDCVRRLMGTVGVTNQISLKSNTQSTDVKTRIEEALKRSAKNEAGKISVSVSGDQVTLTGNVHSISESEDARFAAFSAPGVMSVINDLRVTH